jgi:hypothetical protein
MKKTAVAIVHYHLRPGGVTRVIERAVQSLGDQIDLIILSGEAPAPEAHLTPYCEPFAALAYGSATTDKSDHLARDLRFTAKCLLGREPDIWHIHNHALGKNSFNPQFVRHLAEDSCRLLLQPHDFAEDGRPDNYQRLKTALGDAMDKTLYPVGNHIWYAPINSRDKRLMQQAGFNQIHPLPNPITPAPISSLTPPTSHRMFVYPARAIRRKNLGEFLLWSLIARPGDRFISTLAPKNPLAKPIYEEWVRFAQELNLPVEFDAGNRIPFSDLIMNATALMTTSIAEGFGLAFLEPWLEGKPLIGRNLPEITSDFKNEGIELNALYDTLPIPLHWIGATAFKQELETAMIKSYAAYDRPWKEDYLNRALQSMIQTETVDFGILSETLQRKVIRHLVAHPADRALLPKLDEIVSQKTIDHNRKIVQERYNIEAYGKRLLHLYQTLAAVEPSTTTYLPATALLDQFLQPERFNLLRT